MKGGGRRLLEELKYAGLHDLSTSTYSRLMENLEKDFDGLIFDMDGTLADTMPTHFAAWSQSMAACGLVLTEERFYALGGVPAGVIIEQLAKEQEKVVNSKKIAEEKEYLFLELLGKVRPVGPVMAIAEAHLGKLPMAVATGSPEWMAEKILKALNVHEWFGAIVGMESVINPKPAPDTFLQAAQTIGVDPKRCCAFEDTKLGLQSARNAGMKAIDIYTLLSV